MTTFKCFIEQQERQALIVVDVQRDFMPGGTLGIPNANTIIPVINGLAKRVRNSGGIVVYTADMHPPEHTSFKQQGGMWPAHCVINTFGQRFDPKLDVSGPTFNKGTEPNKDSYSGFGGNNKGQTLENYLRKNNIGNVTIVGVALDYCVKATAIDAKKHGFNTRVILAGTKAVEQDKLNDIISSIEQLGISVVKS